MVILSVILFFSWETSCEGLLAHAYTVTNALMERVNLSRQVT